MKTKEYKEGFYDCLNHVFHLILNEECKHDKNNIDKLYSIIKNEIYEIETNTFDFEDIE